MQVTETVSNGLKRELEVVVKAQELDGKLSTRLEELKDKVRIKGFRPGKVPVAHLRRVYGKSVMAEIVQETVNETTRKALEDRNERPAYEPEISLTENEEEVDQIISGKQDLAFKLSFEVIPEIEVTDLAKLAVEKEVADVSDEDIQKGLDHLIENNVTYESKEEAAETGDQVTIDFLGKIDGEAFSGGSAEDAPVVIGQNAFIPGFEEGLIGIKTGEEKDLPVDFPEDYPSEDLAGKKAVFEVKVKDVASPKKPELNDEFAKTLGLDSIDKLREIVTKQIEEQNNDAARTKLKRKILDALDSSHSFELPETLVDQEFDSVWQQITSEMERSGRKFDAEGSSEEEQKEKYHKLAERRVRLGLLLNEIGQKNEIQISEDDVKQAMIEQAKQYPGQEQQILEMYQKNPQAIAQLRAPIFEEKVIDFIAAMANVSEKTVSSEELYNFPDDE